MKYLLLAVLLAFTVPGRAQTISELIGQSKYAEALAQVQSNAPIGNNDLADLVEWTNRTELIRNKPEDYAVRVALIDSLISRTRSLYSPGRGHSSALGYAIYHGDSSLVRLLLAKGVDPNKPVDIMSGFNAFQYAAYRYPINPYPVEGLSIIKILLAAGANINATTMKEFETHISHTTNVHLPRGANTLDIATVSGASPEVIAYLKSLGLKETVATK